MCDHLSVNTLVMRKDKYTIIIIIIIVWPYLLADNRF